MLFDWSSAENPPRKAFSTAPTEFRHVRSVNAAGAATMAAGFMRSFRY
jgi:hypothetical protein